VQLLAEVQGGQTIARYIMGMALISQKRGGSTYCSHFNARGPRGL